jgi:hypothetical protein
VTSRRQCPDTLLLGKHLDESTLDTLRECIRLGGKAAKG